MYLRDNKSLSWTPFSSLQARSAVLLPHFPPSFLPSFFFHFNFLFTFWRQQTAEALPTCSDPDLASAALYRFPLLLLFFFFLLHLCSLIPGKKKKVALTLMEHCPPFSFPFLPRSSFNLNVMFLQAAWLSSYTLIKTSSCCSKKLSSYCYALLLRPLFTSRNEGSFTKLRFGLWRHVVQPASVYVRSNSSPLN